MSNRPSGWLIGVRRWDYWSWRPISTVPVVVLSVTEGKGLGDVWPAPVGMINPNARYGIHVDVGA